MIDVDNYAKKVYKQNCEIGWWDNPDRCIFQTLQLVVTEIAEATEGDRKNLMDDHLRHRKMAEVELGDAFIRLVDIAGRYGWKYDPKMKLTDRFYLSGKNLAAQHFFLTASVCALGGTIEYEGVYSVECPEGYSLAIAIIFEIAKLRGYDLKGAVDEKIVYNKARADHTRERRRSDPNGKKY